MSDDDEEMQPNPRYEALQELLDLAEGQQANVAEALNDAHRIMNSGEAWSGPTTATVFLDDLGYRKDDLPGLAERLVDDIRDELNSCPKEISVPQSHGGMYPI